MKKIMNISMAALVAMGTFMAACTKEEFRASEGGKPVTLTTSVSLETDETKALTPLGEKTFAVGDQLAVIYKNTEGRTVKAVSEKLTVDDISNRGKSARFTVTVSNPDRTKEVTYIYPAAMAQDDGTVNYGLLASQNGTLEDIAARLDCCTCTAAWKDDSLPPGFLLNHLAICAFTLKNEDGTERLNGGVKSFTVSDGPHTYTITRKASSNPIYVAIRPTSGAHMRYHTKGQRYDNSWYVKESFNKTYVAGGFYELGLKMSLTLRTIADSSDSDRGCVVCTAGHVHEKRKAVPAGCIPVGIIGHVYRPGYGVIVALQDVPPQSWYNIDSWPSDPSYEGHKILPESARNGMLGFSSLGGVAVADWGVPFKSVYRDVFSTLGSSTSSWGYTYDAAVNEFLTVGAGGTAFSGEYWCSETFSASLTTTAWYFGAEGWNFETKDRWKKVRPVLIYNNEKQVSTVVNGQFSVSSTKKVYFSKGNLQYVGAWRFANHQWEIFGSTQRDNHRDLFGWGTGNNPNNVSKETEDYPVWVDWGVNYIDGKNGYRTLTRAEWDYLVQHSPYSKATVNNVHGMVLLPDNWTLPSGCSFNAVPNGSWDSNVYTAEQWSQMENAGAVFLPAAGQQYGDKTLSVGEYLYYWSSDADAESTSLTYALFYFDSVKIGRIYKSDGCAVRLVKDVE